MASTAIQIRLGTTDITESATWLTKDGGNGHLISDPLYGTLTYSQIPNPIPFVYTYYKPNAQGNYAGVSTLRTNEANSSQKGGGGFFLGNSVVENSFVGITVGAKNSIDIKNLVSTFMTARNQDGLTMSLILTGKQGTLVASPIPTHAESNYKASAGAFDQFNADTFYKTSTWISFHSREATVVPKIANSTSFSLRKGFHHGLINLTQKEIAGISQSSSGAEIRSNGSFNWNDVLGLSPNGLCSFSELSSPTNESISAQASDATMNPQIITCSGRQMIFVGISGLDAVFTNTTPQTLFGTLTAPRISTTINWGWADYSSSLGQFSWYTISPLTAALTIRPKYAASFGNKNYLALRLTTATQTRFFGGTSNIGIQVGSYIRISGASNSANNGIYQVLSVQDGVPGDDNENALFPKYQYLELSREIVSQEEQTSQITVENVSNLPIVHIKYTKVIPN